MILLILTVCTAAGYLIARPVIKAIRIFTNI